LDNRWIFLLHVIAALWLAAGVFSGAAVRAVTRRAGSVEGRLMGHRIAARLMTLFSAPGAVVSGLLGLVLTMTRGYGFKPLWVHISLTLYLAMLAVTLFYLLPRCRQLLRAAEAAAASGASGELDRLSAAKLPGILADLNALGIVILTALMIFKPL